MKNTRIVGIFFVLLASAMCLPSLAALSATSSDKAASLIFQLEFNISKLDEGQIRFLDILDEMKLFFQLKNYDEVSSLYNSSMRLLQLRTKLNLIIEEIIILIEEANNQNIDLSDTLVIYNKGLADFKRSDFDSSERSLTRVHIQISDNLWNASQSIVFSLRSIIEDLNGQNISADIVSELTIELAEAEKSKNYAKMFLLSHDIGKLNKSVDTLRDTKVLLLNLEEQGFDIGRYQDDFIQMQTLLSLKKYDEIFIVYNSTIKTIDLMVKVRDDYASLTDELNNSELVGIDFTETVDLLNLSDAEFYLQNYEKSNQYLEDAHSTFQDIKQRYIYKTLLNKANAAFNFREFWIMHWWKILLFVLIVTITYPYFSLTFKTARLKAQIKNIKKELKTVNELTRTLQFNYFKHISIDKEAYTIEFNQLDNRRTTIKERIPILESRLEQCKNKLSFIFRKKISPYTSKKNV